MNGNIKFSIMTPVYKVEKFLDECVQSVLGQSYENFELILVDDGSPDRCGAMCDEWAARDERIKAYHKPNGGLVTARSCALEKASGDYYVFLDSDDMLHENALEVLYGKICETNADCIIYGSEKKLGDKVIERGICEENIAGRLITDRREAIVTVLTNGAYNAIWRKCVRAGCFDGRDYTPYNKIIHGEDLVRSLEVLENARTFIFIADILHVYRCNPDSITQTVCYDDLGVDNRVEALLDEMLERTKVFEPEDYDRLRNTRLDRIAIEAHARMKFCSSDEKAIDGLKRLREDGFNAAVIETGYKNVGSLHTQSRARHEIYAMNISLLRRRRYKTMLFIDKAMRRLTGR